MSRWLSHVTSYLEKLDDQTQNYVEENYESQVDAKDNLDSILAQRGLAVAPNDEEEQEEDGAIATDEKLTAATAQTIQPPLKNPVESAKPQNGEGKIAEKGTEKVGTEQWDFDDFGDPSEAEDDATEIRKDAAEERSDSRKKEQEQNDIQSTGAEEVENKEAKNSEQDEAALKQEQVQQEPEGDEQAHGPSPAETTVPEVPVETKKPPPPFPSAKQIKGRSPVVPKSQPTPSPASAAKDPKPGLVKEAQEAKKEVRTLRRHMVSLNKQLETAETELEAQRKELDGVAERMEKERAKARTERDNERKRHAEEMKAMKEAHDKALQDQKSKMDEQLASLSQRLKEVEETRMQEGGNWDKELHGAIEREQSLLQRNTALEDEKATLEARITTLQSQQEALGDRIESLTQTADNAMEREREAEDRLDQALSVHAHQISQRQARESELEKTIAEMGAALAAARNQETRRSSDHRSTSDISDTAGENTSQDSSLRMRLDMALQDLETAQANLDLEKQRSEALQRELQDLNNERTEEAANARMKQNKHDRQVAELTLQLNRLQQQSETESKKTSSSDDLETGASRNDTEIHDLRNQIKELSEEILKSREKVSSYSSEMSALKSRLKAAIDRADKAEAALEESIAVQNDRMESGAPLSGNVRKRGVKRTGSGTTSITSAMHLSKSERVGKAIDTLDSFSVSTGKYLRANPIARGAFIMYLMVLHLWTFVVIFFHAHNFEDIHRDEMPHGPGLVAQSQLGAGGNLMAAAAAAAKEAKEKTP